MDLNQELSGRTLVIAAHPDDETVGAGVLLRRIAEPVVVFCTDGAPREEFFWGKYGSRQRYGRLRQDEAGQALALAGVSEMLFLAEKAGVEDLFVDQELHLAIRQAAELLDGIICRYRPHALLTLAYEGGHPDHDVCSFLASALGGQHKLPVWEFPLYHRRHQGSPKGGPDRGAGPSSLVCQRFLIPAEDESVLDITPGELELKRRMLAAYASQFPFLSEFDARVERFRPQYPYDYSRPPHPGVLNYEAWRWPVTGKDVCAAFTAWFTSQEKRTA